MEAPGMTYKTLRDEIAMVVLAAILPDTCLSEGDMTKVSYRLADEMLKARELRFTESQIPTSNS